jgi:hypothetical protein
MFHVEEVLDYLYILWIEPKIKFSKQHFMYNYNNKT